MRLYNGSTFYLVQKRETTYVCMYICVLVCNVMLCMCIRVYIYSCAVYIYLFIGFSVRKDL